MGGLARLDDRPLQANDRRRAALDRMQMLIRNPRRAQRKASAPSYFIFAYGGSRSGQERRFQLTASEAASYLVAGFLYGGPPRGRGLVEDLSNKEWREMETCAYCGDEIEGDGFRMYDRVFCSQECLDAYSAEGLDFLEEEYEE